MDTLKGTNVLILLLCLKQIIVCAKMSIIMVMECARVVY